MQFLFPQRGQPAESPWRLALVTILQFAEGLADRAAAESVRSRIDWKYLLGLELEDPGFDYSILSRFRDRLVEGRVEAILLQKLLEVCKEARLIRRRSDMRTDATHVVASVRNLNRNQLVGEIMRSALNALAQVDPIWLSANVDRSWYLKYAKRFGYPREMKSREEIIVEAEDIGRDGMALLERIWSKDAPSCLRGIPAVETLRRCWLGQFWFDNGTLRWRAAGNLPPSSLRADSPYDLEARYGVKRTTEWVGYKVHFTETCSPGGPHLITNVDTTVAHAPDACHIARGQQELARLELLPRRQFVDGSYMGSRAAVVSRKNHGIELVGPVKYNAHHTQINTGYDLSAFVIDWDGHFAICPQGRKSSGWWSGKSRTGRVTFHTKFSRSDCANCAVNQLCIRNGKKNPRKLSILPREEYEWLMAARDEQSAPEWKRIYNMRAGIEGTFSQGVRSFGLRRSRYRGLHKTHLQNVAIACAINLQRLLISSQSFELPRLR